MSKKSNITPNICMFLDINNFYNIPILIVPYIDRNNILYLDHIIKYNNRYQTRLNLINKIKELIIEFKVDTIIFEQNKLFIDKIDKYPDPLIMRDILFGYSIQTSIEDNFYNINYILAFPEYEWQNRVLNKKVKYSIDLYKSHVLLTNSFDNEYIEKINSSNYYKILCFRDIINYEDIFRKEFMINKGD